MKEHHTKESSACSETTNKMEELLAMVMAHKSNHHQQTTTLEIDRCKKVLGKLNQVVPKLMRNIIMRQSEDQSSSKRLESLCTLIQLLLQGDVCPHSMAFFHDGNPATVAPMLFYMLPALMNTRVSSTHQKVVEIAAQLTLLIRQTDLKAYVHFYHDLIILLEDLVAVLAAFTGKPNSTTKPIISCFITFVCHVYNKVESPEPSPSDAPSCCKGQRDIPTRPEIKRRIPMLEFGTENAVRLFLGWILDLTRRTILQSLQFFQGSSDSERLYQIIRLLLSSRRVSCSPSTTPVLYKLSWTLCTGSSLTPHNLFEILVAMCSSQYLFQPNEYHNQQLVAQVFDFILQDQALSRISAGRSIALRLQKAFTVILASKNLDPALTRAIGRMLEQWVYLRSSDEDNSLVLQLLFSRKNVPALHGCIVRSFLFALYHDADSQLVNYLTSKLFSSGISDSLPGSMLFKRRKTGDLNSWSYSQMSNSFADLHPVSSSSYELDELHLTPYTIGTENNILRLMENWINIFNKSLRDAVECVSRNFLLGLRMIMPLRTMFPELQNVILERINVLQKSWTREFIQRHVGGCVNLLLIFVEYTLDPVEIAAVWPLLQTFSESMQSKILVKSISQESARRKIASTQVKKTQLVFGREFLEVVATEVDLEPVLACSLHYRCCYLITRLCALNPHLETPIEWVQDQAFDFVFTAIVADHHVETGDPQFVHLLPLMMQTIPEKEARVNFVSRVIEQVLKQDQQQSHLLDILQVIQQMICLAPVAEEESSRNITPDRWRSCIVCSGVFKAYGLAPSFVQLGRFAFDTTTDPQIRIQAIRALLQLLFHMPFIELRTIGHEIRRLFELLEDTSSVIREYVSRHAFIFVSIQGQQGEDTMRLIDVLRDHPDQHKRYEDFIQFFHLGFQRDRNLEALMITISSIASVCDRSDDYEFNLFLWALFRLIQLWAKSSPSVGRLAYDQIQRILRHHDLNWQELCKSYPSHVYPHLLHQFKLSTPTLRLFLLLYVGEHVNTQVLVESSAPFVLPQLILEQNSEMLQWLFGILFDTPEGSDEEEEDTREPVDRDQQIQQFVLSHIVFIVKELIMDQVDQPTEQRSSNARWNFLLQFMPANYSVRDTVGHAPQRLLNSIAWELAGTRSSVAKRAFWDISRYLKEIASSHSSDVSSGGARQEIIPKEYFLALMTDLGGKVASSSSNLAIRQRSLQCIHEVLKLFGSKGEALDPFVPKVMATLKLPLQEPGLRSAAVDAWSTFVRMLSISALKDNICSIVVCLLACIRDPSSESGDTTDRSWQISKEQSHEQKPLDEALKYEHKYAEQIAIDILQYLFFEKRSELEDVFIKVPFVPAGIPALAEIHRVIEFQVQIQTLESRIEEMTKILLTGNSLVRERILLYLNQLLTVNAEAIQSSLIETNEPFVSPVIANLIYAILRLCCTDSSNSRLKILGGSCLGAIGAIDPARMPLQSTSSPSSSTYRSSELSVKELACSLIEDYLVKALRAAPENTDSVGFTIQELLRFLASLNWNSSMEKDKADQTQLSKRELPMPEWMQKRFELKGVYDVVAPYWRTNYRVESSKSKASSTSIQLNSMDSFYACSSSYEDWIISWAKYLITLTSCAEQKIFHACRTALSTHADLARFLLPYLIQNVLRSGRSQDYARIKHEVVAVLRGQKDSSSAPSAVGSRHHQSAQAIFSTLVELSDWINKREIHKKRQRRTKQGTEMEYDHEKENLEEFIKDIPNRLLAEAAFSVKAYARAVQYFESYLRQRHASPVPLYSKTGHLSNRSDSSLASRYLSSQLTHVVDICRSDASYLQRIYSCCDEPDGLVGLEAHRRLRAATRGSQQQEYQEREEQVILDPNPPPNLMDQIIDYENAGHWENALMCYEQALQNLQFHDEEDDEDDEVPPPTRATTQPKSWKDRMYLYTGSIKCMVMLGRLEGALHHVEGILALSPKVLPSVYPYVIESAWRLSKWDYLDKMVSNHPTLCPDHPQVRLGHALGAFYKRDGAKLVENIQQARLASMGPLAAASIESYQRAYPFLLHLHVLHEVEQGFLASQVVAQASSGTNSSTAAIYDKQVPWENRLRLLSPSMKCREPVLAVRRILLQEIGLTPQVGQNWLQCAKMARASGQWQIAANAVLHARALRAPNALLENAKLLQVQGDSYKALQLLEPMPIQVHALFASGKAKEDFLRSKTLLLTTNWIASSSAKPGNQILNRYKAVVRMNSTWEKGYYYLAKYYEKLYESTMDTSSTSSSSTPSSSSSKKTKAQKKQAEVGHEYLVLVFENYLKALEFGTKYILRSLPRILTLWFEYGEKFHRPRSTSKSKTKATSSSIVLSLTSIQSQTQYHERVSREATPEERQFEELHRIVLNGLQTLPTYEWLACLPQIASRICHPNPLVVEGVKAILVAILERYPKQTMWSILGLTQSSNTDRRFHASEILRKAQAALSHDDSEALNEGVRLFDELIALSKQDPVGQKKLDIKLSRLRYPVLIPINRVLLAHFPESGKAEPSHEPFRLPQLCIRAFKEKADVMNSKEKPKRLKLLGTDGQTYSFLCKREQHGDLRKDARMMEINTMVNKLLQHNSACRKRNLRVRTYAVTCLNEESGVLEWVNHTSTMRQLISSIYKTSSGFLQPVRLTREIRDGFLQMQKKYAHDLPAMAMAYRRMFLSLPAFTPRFHQWFLSAFPDPTAWFEARLTFARSAAVWSMLGHVVGLGDRHGENILIDTTNGECVHVDFDCLFDKGLQLACPEIVPFRLTPNMIDAFGLTGYEGTYRKVAQVTMDLLRQNKETVLSVLEAFIHDPLVEWGRSGKTQKAQSHIGVKKQSRKNINGVEEAKQVVQKINRRLDGVYNLHKISRTKESVPLTNFNHVETLPLSVEGQVEKLIQEAVSEENLAQMYFGWMPFL